MKQVGDLVRDSFESFMTTSQCIDASELARGPLHYIEPWLQDQWEGWCNSYYFYEANSFEEAEDIKEKLSQAELRYRSCKAVREVLSNLFSEREIALNEKIKELRNSLSAMTKSRDAWKAAYEGLLQ